MSNKYLYMVVGAIVAVVWFYTGHSAYYSGGSADMSDGWWFGMLLAIGLGAGSTGGADLGSIFVESIKGYIPTLILLVIMTIVGHSLYVLVTTHAVPGAANLAMVTITIVVSAFLTNMMLSYLRKALA